MLGWGGGYWNGFDTQNIDTMESFVQTSSRQLLFYLPYSFAFLVDVEICFDRRGQLRLYLGQY